MTRPLIWLCVSGLFLLGQFHFSNSLDCTSCGGHCQLICGHKDFRACCYNYLKKRNTPSSSGTGVHSELMMIDSEAPQYNIPLLKNALTKYGAESYPEIHSGRSNRKNYFKEIKLLHRYLLSH